MKLLNRDHRVASPTPSGRQMMVYAEKLIGLRAAMIAEIGDRSAMRGVMRLGVAETIVHTWLPRLVKSMNEVYPNLSLEIEVDITPNLTARLLAQEIELAFVVGPLSASGVHNRVLADYPIGFLASPSLRLGDGPVTRAELARFPIITFPRKTRPYEVVREVFDRPELPPIRLHASALACDRHPHGGRGPRHRRDPRRHRRERARRRAVATARHRSQNRAADIHRELARLARCRGGGAGRRACMSDCAEQPRS
ncbi:DNA-binding transcriptional LysR family regulator [Bradyrhizobium sp. GM2.4]